jgi:hypothetical protein
MNGMAEQISLIFNDNLYEEGWDLRKKSKSGWRYLKHIIKHMFSWTE